MSQETKAYIDFQRHKTGPYKVPKPKNKLCFICFKMHFNELKVRITTKKLNKEEEGQTREEKRRTKSNGCK